MVLKLRSKHTAGSSLIWNYADPLTSLALQTFYRNNEIAMGATSPFTMGWTSSEVRAGRMSLGSPQNSWDTAINAEREKFAGEGDT